MVFFTELFCITFSSLKDEESTAVRAACLQTWLKAMYAMKERVRTVNYILIDISDF